MHLLFFVSGVANRPWPAVLISQDLAVGVELQILLQSRPDEWSPEKKLAYGQDVLQWVMGHEACQFS